MRQTPSRALTWMQQAPLNRARTLLRSMRQRTPHAAAEVLALRLGTAFTCRAHWEHAPHISQAASEDWQSELALRFGGALMRQPL